VARGNTTTPEVAAEVCESISREIKQEGDVAMARKKTPSQTAPISAETQALRDSLDVLVDGVEKCARLVDKMETLIGEMAKVAAALAEQRQWCRCQKDNPPGRIFRVS
jgi:hypothetical protein